MSLKDFEKIKNNETKMFDDGYDFRTVYIENIVNHAEIKNIGYYFDNDGEKPLYEIILIYKNEELRDIAAKKIFGEPNYKEKEWRITRKKSYNLWAWSFKTKLIIVGMIPETEWSDQNW
jgi:hypothetical protein